MRALMFAFAVVMGWMPAGAWAEKLSLGEISSYLNSLGSVSGTFTQVNSDGSVSKGTILIKRPGRMRFEYDPPDELTVIAGAGAVVILDGNSNAPPETYPLRRTPLSLVLAPRVDLAADRLVTDHAFDGTATVVTAQDPDEPDSGNIRMFFTAEPVALRQWVLTDGNGISTTIILDPLKVENNIPNTKFDTGRFTARRD